MALFVALNSVKRQARGIATLQAVWPVFSPAVAIASLRFLFVLSASALSLLRLPEVSPPARLLSSDGWCQLALKWPF
jgi:hypothetical protein